MDHLDIWRGWGLAAGGLFHLQKESVLMCDLSADVWLWAGRTQSEPRVAARRAWLWGPLQAPVPPYRYPAARHHVLLIYCYTGFHN